MMMIMIYIIGGVNGFGKLPEMSEFPGESAYRYRK